MTDRKQLRRVIMLGTRDFESADEVRGRQAALMKIGIDVRFHRARDHDRIRLIAITASRRPDAAIKEEATSPSAASAKPASGHNENHNGVGGDDHASEQVLRMPFIRPKVRAHVTAHRTVIGQERWFHKGQLFLPGSTK